MMKAMLLTIFIYISYGRFHEFALSLFKLVLGLLLLFFHSTATISITSGHRAATSFVCYMLRHSQ